MTSDKTVYFWKPNEQNGIYSQWYRSPITAKYRGKNVVFPTAEHFMMYHKAKLFGDTEIMQAVLDTKDPSKVRSLGRKVKNFDDEKWEKNRIKIVYNGNYLKFTQNQDLYNILMNEKASLFVEASPSDRIWGIGYKAENAEKNIDKWGTNLLGKVIGKVREMLRKELE